MIIQINQVNKPLNYSTCHYFVSKFNLYLFLIFIKPVNIHACVNTGINICLKPNQVEII